MSLSPGEITALAERLHHAQRTRTEIPGLAASTDYDLDDAYAIQSALVGMREAEGDGIIGVKLGFTSEAKMAQMGISEVVVGRLTETMLIACGEDVDLARFIHPKAEPEIAYRLARDVDDTADIESCVDSIAPAIEIIDSRYLDFRFTHTDVVADNTSAAGYVLGEWLPMCEARDRAVWLTVGARHEFGRTSAILGDPVRALHALVEVARRRGIPLRAGYTVLAGAATAAIRLTPGLVDCQVAGLGSVHAKVRS